MHYLISDFVTMFLTNVNVQKIEQILRLEKAPALHDHLLFDRVRVSQTQLLFAMYYLPVNKILLPIYTICFELFRSERGYGRYLAIGASCTRYRTGGSATPTSTVIYDCRARRGPTFLRRRRSKKEQLSKEVHNAVRVNTAADKYQ